MLNPNQIAFLKEQFGISEKDIKNISLEKWKEIRLKCFEIEGAEAMKIADKSTCILSDLGEIAASIVDTKYKQIFA